MFLGVEPFSIAGSPLCVPVLLTVETERKLEAKGARSPSWSVGQAAVAGSASLLEAFAYSSTRARTQGPGWNRRHEQVERLANVVRGGEAPLAHTDRDNDT